MMKTLKNIRVNTLLVSSVFLLLSHAQAQSIIFSSDQWPKRWERAMQNRPMNGYVAPSRSQGDRHSSREIKNGFYKASHKGWGQQPDTNRHQRSRTPEYNYDSRNKYQGDAITQRYALPKSRSIPSGYGHYSAPGYYGNTTSAYPNAYVGHSPGFGMPGSPYGTPLYMGPGAYPGIGYPGMGYPGMGYPGMGYPGMGYPGMGYPGMGYPGIGSRW